jgi:hypothetical protein
MDLPEAEEVAETSSPGRKLKSYANEFKQRVIKHAKAVSVKNASKKLGVDRKTIRNWMNKEKDIQLQMYVFMILLSSYFKLSESSTIGKSRKRLAGGGRKLAYKDLDDQLAQWVREHRKLKHRISRRIIQQQAERMFNVEIDGEGFKV